jgi:hypothetical protein
MGLFSRRDHAVDVIGPNTGPGAMSPRNDGMAGTPTGHGLTGNHYDQDTPGPGYNENAVGGYRPHTGMTDNQAGHPALTGNRYDNTATSYNENSVAGNHTRDHGLTGHHHGTTGTGYNENSVAGNYNGTTGHTQHKHSLSGNHHDNSISGTHQHGHIHDNHHHEGAAAGAAAVAGAGVVEEKHHGRSLFSRHPRDMNTATTNGTTKPRRGLFGARTHETRESTGAMSTTSRPRFGQWLKATWLDLLTMIILGAIGLGVSSLDDFSIDLLTSLGISSTSRAISVIPSRLPRW